LPSPRRPCSSVRPQLAKLEVRSAGFLDDKNLAGQPAALRKAFELTERASAAGGQVSNWSKCFLMAPADKVAEAARAWPGARILTGARVVGVPVGTDDYVREHARAFVTRAAEARDTVLNRLGAQQALYLLRCSAGWPAVQHVLRGTPLRLSAPAAEAHDASLQRQFARLVGAPDAAQVAAWPLAAAIHLPLRLGGWQAPRAELLRGVACASAIVQRRRLLDSAFPPPSASPPDITRLPLFLPRLSGRPARDEDGAAVGPECRGAGKCHMPPSPDCTRHMCSPCCALAHNGLGCAHCTAEAARADAELERELPGVRALAQPAVHASADAFGAPRDATWRAFALAARFHKPQRAACCSLYGFAAEKLRRELGPREQRLLEAAGSSPSYSWLLAAPLGYFAVPDAVFTCAARLRMGAPILSPTSTHCVTLRGNKPRRCTLNGCAGGNADSHALSCKCGGHAITTHNFCRSRLARLLKSWGLPCEEEAHDFLSGGAASKIDLFIYSAGQGRAPLAVDLTRRFGAPLGALTQAENDKVTKYLPKYTVLATVRGFAFDELGRCGPQAVDVADMLVMAGARMGAGHPQDLAREFWATLGVALASATAARLAHFARINHDTNPGVPTEASLAPGQRFATGAWYRLARTTPRRRPAPYCIARLPAKPRAPREAAGPSLESPRSEAASVAVRSGSSPARSRSRRTSASILASESSRSDIVSDPNSQDGSDSDANPTSTSASATSSSHASSGSESAAETSVGSRHEGLGGEVKLIDTSHTGLRAARDWPRSSASSHTYQLESSLLIPAQTAEVAAAAALAPQRFASLAPQPALAASRPASPLQEHGAEGCLLGGLPEPIPGSPLAAPCAPRRAVRASSSSAASGAAPRRVQRGPVPAALARGPVALGGTAPARATRPTVGRSCPPASAETTGQRPSTPAQAGSGASGAVSGCPRAPPAACSPERRAPSPPMDSSASGSDAPPPPGVDCARGALVQLASDDDCSSD
jgi:hypothetical protein